MGNAEGSQVRPRVPDRLLTVHVTASFYFHPFLAKNLLFQNIGSGRVIEPEEPRKMILWECVRRYESMLLNKKPFQKHFKQVIINRYIVLKFLVIFIMVLKM